MASTYINPVPRLAFPGMDPRQAQHLNLLVDAVNSLAGHNGVIELNNHLSLKGNTIQNVGPAVNDNDVVSQAFANNKYSAEALRPQLEANGSTPLQSVRRINDSTQREQTSTWLNAVMSTPPNSNNAQVSFVNGGPTTQVSINANNLTRADKSVQPLAGLTAILTNPTSFTILTIARAGGVVTATFGASPGLLAGTVVGVTGVADSSFDGTFVLTGAVGATLTWNQNLSDGTSTGGTLSTAGVFYAYAIPYNPTMFISGPFAADSPQNRINASHDNRQIIAVIVLHSGGGVSSQSGGGGTPTTGDVAGGTFF